MTALAEVDVPRGTSVPLDARIHRLPLEFISIEANVRVVMAGLDELTASIAEQGVISPIKVRHAPDGAGYIVTWGHRRLLASRQAGLTDIPAFIDDAEQTLEERSIEQLIENLHREDLNPIDRATAMRAVVAAGMTQADLARKLGLAPSTIANDLGLLEAPVKVRALVEEGALTPSHAKALKGLAPKTQQELAKDAVERGYSAHRLEEEVQRRKRQAEEETKREQAGAAKREKNRADLEAAIAELAAKPKPGLDTEIVVFPDYYGQSDPKVAELAELLKKAGFAKVRIASGSGNPDARPSGGVCDCTAWKATLRSTYSYKSNGYTTKLQATPACIVDAHREAKAIADRKAELAKYALQDQVRAHVKATATGAVIPSTSNDTPLLIGVPRILAEAALWGLLGYRLPEWSVARGGKRNNAWSVIHALTDEALADLLGQEIANDFRDKAGYHVDWPTLAAELGLIEPEPPVRPTRSVADGPKATTDALEVTAAAPPGARKLNLGDPVLLGDRPLKVLSISYPPAATRQATIVSLRPIDLGKDIDVSIDRLAWDRKAKSWRIEPEVPA